MYSTYNKGLMLYYVYAYMWWALVYTDSPGDKLHYQSPEAMNVDFLIQIIRWRNKCWVHWTIIVTWDS